MLSFQTAGPLLKMHCTDGRHHVTEGRYHRKYQSFIFQMSDLISHQPSKDINHSNPHVYIL